MAGEFEAAGFAIHLEDGDDVAALIATIEELAGGGRRLKLQRDIFLGSILPR